MSALNLNKRLTEAELKAPTGHFRVVKVQMRRGDSALEPAAYFLVGDFLKRHEALARWRDLAHKHMGEDMRFTFYDDKGRVNDAVGARITQEDRRAPLGKFRIVCIDFATEPAVVKLVADLDYREKAIEYARTANEGPYTGFQVHDDTGATLIPVG
ncbi:MAG: hypothetical protein Q7R90_01850 [bacterium]|nr:hypothetical protein [bacterium]